MILLKLHKKRTHQAFLLGEFVANPVDYDTKDAMHPIEKSGCIFAPQKIVLDMGDTSLHHLPMKCPS